MKQSKIEFIARAAIIGALYAALTLVLAPISYGLIQFRISEALSVLAFFTPTAIPGLFVGCLVANLIGPNGILDIVFGSLATLIAAFITYKINNKYLAPLPPVIINAFVMGPIIAYYMDVSFYIGILYVGIGQLLVCYLLGLPLLFALQPVSGQLFKNEKNRSDIQSGK